MEGRIVDQVILSHLMLTIVQRFVNFKYMPVNEFAGVYWISNIRHFLLFWAKFGYDMPKVIEKRLIEEFKDREAFSREELFDFYRYFEPDLKRRNLRLEDIRPKREKYNQYR